MSPSVQPCNNAALQISVAALGNNFGWLVGAEEKVLNYLKTVREAVKRALKVTTYQASSENNALTCLRN
jgi:hypothetical protein